VADDPVVVLKALPMKASNGVEDKTKLIFICVWRSSLLPKA